MPDTLELVLFKNRDEVKKCAFQAGHVMNSTVAGLPSRRVARISRVDQNTRQAHMRRTRNGAFRASSLDRFGSGSASAVWTYISIASVRSRRTSSNDSPWTARSKSRQNASHWEPWPLATHRTALGIQISSCPVNRGSDNLKLNTQGGLFNLKKQIVCLQHFKPRRHCGLKAAAAKTRRHGMCICHI